jgi:hypothetical protein
MARRVRDGFYPKQMLQLDEVSNLDDIIQDAIAFKYIAQPLSAEQIALLLPVFGGAEGRISEVTRSNLSDSATVNESAGGEIALRAALCVLETRSRRRGRPAESEGAETGR